MAIEKMALVYIEGPLKKVNKTLMSCCESKCFHVTQSSHRERGGFEKGSFRTFRDRNVYQPLIKRAQSLSGVLGIKPEFTDYDTLDFNVSVDFADYFKELEGELSSMIKRRDELKQSLEQYNRSLTQVEQLAGMNSDFSEIFKLKYVKVRFGRLPADNYPKLSYYEDRSFLFFPFESDKDYVYGVYFTPVTESTVVDDIFSSIFFERIKMPDYLKGNADEAKSGIIRVIKQQQEELEEIEKALDAYREKEKEKFLQAYSKLIALNESYELRSNVSVINSTFFLSGYVPERECKKFTAMVTAQEGVTARLMPADSEPGQPPVKLRNCALFRPFEMFVNMYGLPDYNGIDPTPFVAISYMLIYGIMFGDLGQGLFIFAFGLFLWLWKKVKLGAVMTRIGITSAIFGTLYGSVFGNEEIIKPFFKIPSVYSLMGYGDAPKDIFQISSYLLIAALAIGVILILISMLLNIGISIKNRSLSDGVFGPNGVAGLVFYTSIVVGAVLQLLFNTAVFTPVYIIFLIVLPLAMLFFREPLTEFFGNRSRRHGFRKAGKNTHLAHAVKTYSDAVANVRAAGGNRNSFEALASSDFVTVRYGEMERHSYELLWEHTQEQYFFFPFDSDDDKITGVYIAADTERERVDRLFSSLGFVVKKMPHFIGDMSKETARDVEKSEKKKSVGTFIIEGIIELFESCLTYITNTMSFLRVGGFILSHAGMMLVVNVLAGLPGNPVGQMIVLVLGNAFVIGMEGFLVGIQVLRLEFYEIFSRFYKGSGKPFTPVSTDVEIK